MPTHYLRYNCWTICIFKHTHLRKLNLAPTLWYCFIRLLSVSVKPILLKQSILALFWVWLIVLKRTLFDLSTHGLNLFSCYHPITTRCLVLPTLASFIARQLLTIYGIWYLVIISFVSKSAQCWQPINDYCDRPQLVSRQSLFVPIASAAFAGDWWLWVWGSRDVVHSILGVAVSGPIQLTPSTDAKCFDGFNPESAWLHRKPNVQQLSTWNWNGNNFYCSHINAHDINVKLIDEYKSMHADNRAMQDAKITNGAPLNNTQTSHNW